MVSLRVPQPEDMINPVASLHKAQLHLGTQAAYNYCQSAEIAIIRI